jgi:hypothetical protein
MKKSWMVYACLIIVLVFLNILARNSTTFCNWYIEVVLPIGINTLGRVMGWFPFSVGELMIGAVIVYAALTVLLALTLFVYYCMRVIQSVYRYRLNTPKATITEATTNEAISAGTATIESKRTASHTIDVKTLSRHTGTKKHNTSGLLRFARAYGKSLAWVILSLLWLCSLNAFMLYHGDTFAQMYFPMEEENYTLEELTALRNYVVERCNALSMLVERDANGDPIYKGDMKEAAIEAMQSLGQTYTRLDGFYPKPKELLLSDFCSQQYIQGYYFPFSMEANYNGVMYIMNKPATMCHELAHLRGYLLEDEANFIGFLACIMSDDIFFQYSGYLSVLNYLDNDYYRALGSDVEQYMQQIAIDPRVSADNVFVTSQEWERIEKEGWFQTEDVDAMTDTLIDVNLKANGIEDGILSYNRVVKLLMQYYRNP